MGPVSIRIRESSRASYNMNESRASGVKDLRVELYLVQELVFKVST